MLWKFLNFPLCPLILCPLINRPIDILLLILQTYRYIQTDKPDILQRLIIIALFHEAVNLTTNFREASKQTANLCETAKATRKHCGADKTTTNFHEEVITNHNTRRLNLLQICDYNRPAKRFSQQHISVKRLTATAKTNFQMANQ